MRPRLARYWGYVFRRFIHSQVVADLIWISLFVFTLLLIRAGKPTTKIILLAAMSIFVLRFAPRIPGLRWFWVGLFGERTFWDWMTLLCAPILLSSIGLLISTSINNQQNDMAVTRERLNLANDYYNKISELILMPEFRDLIAKRRAQALALGPPNHDKENCDPDRENPLTSMAYSRTAAVLRTLNSLRTSHEEYTSMQQGIVQLLYYSGLIHRQGHIVSLQQANLSQTRLANIDLSKSCFDSINFEGSFMARVKLDSSNLMRSSFRGANLYKAKLREVNLANADLSEADARGALFNNSDMRGSFLIKTNLQGADLYNATLIGANLAHADLRGAKLERADLRSADLTGADLRGANLHLAIIDNETKLVKAKYNTRQINNEKSAQRSQAIYAFLESLLLHRAFEMGGLSRSSFNLPPTTFDQSLDPVKRKMKMDHRI